MAKILIVDDEATITTQLEERLSRLGYQVAGCASSGKEAVEMAEEIQPDLVLMDIVMPGQWDGIEAASRITAKADVPIIFLTAYGDDRLIKRARAAGPFGYILKPFQEAELKANVEIALYNHKLKKKLLDSEMKWRSLAENIEDAVILSDKKSLITFWNRGAEKIFGYHKSETIGKSLKMILSEGVREGFEKIYNEILSGIQTGEYAKKIQIVGLRKDFNRFPLDISLKPWIRKNESFMIVLARDISDSKKWENGMRISLKEAETKLNDIKGRVKDNLEAVTKLLDLQHEWIGGKKNRDVDRIQEKISLTTQGCRINFEEYIHNLGRHLFHAHKVEPGRITFIVKSGGISLDIQSAVYCSMVASELISNAIKYAFPEKEHGEIMFKLEEQKGHYLMTVQDNGVGFPLDFNIRAPETPGFQFINSLLAQIGGKIRLKQGKGTIFELTFPADAEMYD